MEKKKILAFTLGGLLLVAVTFNVATTASFTKKLGKAEQIISSAGFEVVKDDQFLKGIENFEPGDVIDQDKIILTNNNTYPVKFKITLTETSEENSELLKYLVREIYEGDNKLKISEDTPKYIEVTVQGKSSKEVYAKVKFNGEESIDADTVAGKSATYNYEIVAEQIISSNISEENN